MIDFTIKKPGRPMGGLNMGLSAGPYEGMESLNRAVYVAEDAFFVLESSVVKHCPRYGNYGHWGVTEIHRDVWHLILQDWAVIEEVASTANEVRSDFAASLGSFAGMRNELSEWIREALRSNEQVCILGI